MYLSEIIIDFLEYLEIEKGRSQKTVENYDRYLQRLVEFAGDIKISEVDHELIRKWRLWLNRLKDKRGATMGKSTQNYHLIALRSLLKYCAKRDIETLTADKIELAKTHKKKVNFLTREEIERMLEQPNTEKESGLRDRAIISLLFSGGLRVSELVDLDKEHINLKRKEFMVRGKGQKDRPVFISDEAAHWIAQYLEKRKDSLPLCLSATAARRMRRTTATICA